MQTRFVGVIFDFNGVLWWGRQLQELVWNRFSTEIRGRPFSPEEMAVHVHGRNNSHALHYLTGRALPPEEIERLTQQKETIYRQLCLDEGEDFRLSPGATELLDFLVAHGIGRTIATASEKTNLDFFVEHLGLERWFEVAQIVYDDGSLAGKPAPDFYLQAATNLDLLPGSCVVVEDAVSGIQAASAAEIGHIIALGPKEMHQELAQRQGVSEVVESLRDVRREELFLMGDLQ